MNIAEFRFYEELNDFLPRQRKKTSFHHPFRGRNSVKDMIEALGVPHTEVDLIIVNGQSVDFSYLVQDGDRISVYPVFEAFDITPLVRLRPKPLRKIRFVLDVHLGRLARYLRLLGFDTLYQNDYRDTELARLASEQHRILLTRDRGLLKRSVITHGYYVRATAPQRQLEEIFARFDLYRSICAFQRCLRCNGAVVAIAKEHIWERIEPNTRRYFNEFWICNQCHQIYWKGSHYLRMRCLVQHLLEQRISPAKDTSDH